MAANKYQHLILTKPLNPPLSAQNSAFMAATADFYKKITGATGNFALYYIMRGGMFLEPPHWHRSVEMLMFMSTDPHDMKNLGATVELGLGPKWEKHSFSNSCFVRFPVGLEHGPFYINKFERPFLFGHYWATGEPAHLILAGETEPVVMRPPEEDKNK
jgi:hypothetical protein